MVCDIWYKIKQSNNVILNIFIIPKSWVCFSNLIWYSLHLFVLFVKNKVVNDVICWYWLWWYQMMSNWISSCIVLWHYRDFFFIPNRTGVCAAKCRLQYRWLAIDIQDGVLMYQYMFVKSVILHCTQMLKYFCKIVNISSRWDLQTQK